jgi:hypothetical protein
MNGRVAVNTIVDDIEKVYIFENPLGRWEIVVRTCIF